MKRIGTLLAAGLAATAIAAPLAEGAATRAEYIAQADPICAKANKVANQQLPGFGDDVDAERWKGAARRFRVTLRAFNGMIASLSSLQPPAADAALISQWLEGLRSQSPQAKAVIAAVKQHSRKKVVARSGRLAKNSRRTKELVASYGFKACDQS
jgi:hypothetical protein